MAVRSSLVDRTYTYWARVKRISSTTKSYDDNDEFLDVDDEHEIFGVGSVLRIIPGIDISLLYIDIVKQLANAVFAPYYNISRVYSKRCLR